MAEQTDVVAFIRNKLYAKNYQRGRMYKNGDVTITAYVRADTVLLFQTVRDRHSGHEDYSCLYQPVSHSNELQQILDAIP